MWRFLNLVFLLIIIVNTIEAINQIDLIRLDLQIPYLQAYQVPELNACKESIELLF